MNRLTEKHWRNLDPWECCGQDNYCQRGCHVEGGCTGGCIVPENYTALAKYEDTGLTPEEVADLRTQLALTEKALELACQFIEWDKEGSCCPNDYTQSNILPECNSTSDCIEMDLKNCWKKHFLAQAKAGDRP